MLFQDKNASDFGFEREFPSKWKIEKKSRNFFVQTDIKEVREVGTQRGNFVDIGVQTQVKPSRAVNNNDVESFEVIDFLRKTATLMEKELEESSKSRAFDGYKSQSYEEKETVLKKLWILQIPKDLIDNDGSQVSALSWNCSSTTIAVGYNRKNHENWCNHSTKILLWNVLRRDLDTRSPHFMLTCPTCIVDVAFHPEEPETFVAGGHSGELFLWKMADLDDNSLTSNSEGHIEKITALKWIVSDKDRKYRILSASLDGKIIIWYINEEERRLVREKELQTKVENLPRSLKLKSRSRSEVGITSLSLCREDKNIIVYGTEAGVLLQTSLVLLEEEKAVTVFSPIFKGRVEDVDFSHHHKFIFCSVGSDKEIRLYDVFHPTAPLRVVHLEKDISSVRWSTRRSTTLSYIYGGSIYYYDLYRKREVFRAGEEGYSFTKLRSSENGKSAASGDVLGRCIIWRIKEDFISDTENQLFTSTLVPTAEVVEAGIHLKHLP